MAIQRTPWPPEYVAALNTGQRDPNYHPYTCGGNRSDAAHRAYAEANGDTDAGVLVATPDGWACPVCGYTQGWAHG